MIIGIGIDMVQVQRMNKWMETPGLTERYFHPEELQYSMINGNNAVFSLAARFAAKEAFGKALGTGLEGIELKDIMIKNKENGQPELHIFGTALRALEKKCTDPSVKIHVSLSHEKEHAMAMVILEKDSRTAN